MTDEKKFTCGCGAVYTLETLPEQCTGTRDGRRCRVMHFGDWARANARLKTDPGALPEVAGQLDRVGKMMLTAVERGDPDLGKLAEEIKVEPKDPTFKFKVDMGGEERTVVQAFDGVTLKRTDVPVSEDLKRWREKILYGDPAKPTPFYGSPKWLEEMQKTGQAPTKAEIEKILNEPVNLPDDPRALRKLISDIFESPEERKKRVLDQVRAVAAEHGLPPPEEVEKKLAELRKQGYAGEALDKAITVLAENDHREETEKTSACSCLGDLNDPMRKKKCPRHGVAPWLKVKWPAGARIPMPAIK